jgi:hypothetical protein
MDHSRPWTGRIHNHLRLCTGPYTIHMNGRHSCIILYHSILRRFMPSTEVHDNILARESAIGQGSNQHRTRREEVWSSSTEYRRAEELNMDVRLTLVTNRIVHVPSAPINYHRRYCNLQVIRFCACIHPPLSSSPSHPPRSHSDEH